MSSSLEVRGIFHGPYPAAPADRLTEVRAMREACQIVDGRSDGDVVADIQSQWQYEQHAAAVQSAAEEGSYNPDAATWMLSKVLYPLSRDFRDPGDWR